MTDVENQVQTFEIIQRNSAFSHMKAIVKTFKKSERIPIFTNVLLCVLIKLFLILPY